MFIQTLDRSSHGESENRLAVKVILEIVLAV